MEATSAHCRQEKSQRTEKIEKVNVRTLRGLRNGGVIGDRIWKNGVEKPRVDIGVVLRREYNHHRSNITTNILNVSAYG